LSRLRHGLPDRRAARRSRAADAALQEDACVQCGLCKATCPEKVISLTPQIDFTAVMAPARVIKEEEPFHCISCGKPFGTKSTIERVTAKLEGKHWMFKGQPQRLDVLKMCEDCRVTAMVATPSIPTARRNGRPCARPRTICASARSGSATGRRSYFGVVAFSRKSISALRSSADVMRCSGILVPGVYFIGPTSNNRDTVSGVQTMSIFCNAGEKL
jgi:ferredoxin